MLEQAVPLNAVTEWFTEIRINVWELIERIRAWKNCPRCGVEENCGLLGWYASSSGNLLKKFPNKLSVPSSGVEGTDRLSRNVGKKLPPLATQEPRKSQFSYEKELKCCWRERQDVLRPFHQDGIASDYKSLYVFLVLRQHDQVTIIRSESVPFRTSPVRCKSSGVCCLLSL